ncbi:MAG: VCBS repeat-containing protein [Kofleriaceae bacterium]|nr:VCBS repeat-containing protein [Kofleriaceae bacterium]MBP9167108.1 VCBS repeat-containing protein [Kofleriaceae bacterium]
MTAAAPVTRGLWALAATASVATAAPLAPPVAPDGGGVIGALWRDAVAELEAASAARLPPLVPPTPRPVRWKARRIASLDLGGPLLALAAVDLDGDRADELIALTEGHVIALGAHGAGLRERARLRVPAEAPAVRPREPIGVVAAVGAEVVARSSSSARGARYGWRDGRLVELAPVAGFPACADRTIELAAGRNYAVVDGAELWAVRCRIGTVDPVGRATAAVATVATTGTATVTVETRCVGGPPACQPTTTATLEQVGAAIELDDVDRDGAFEVLVTGSGPPGDGDAVVVWRLTERGFAPKPVFRRGFLGGVVALAVGDVDGDGDREAFAAVRLVGGRKVDLWLLD